MNRIKTSSNFLSLITPDHVLKFSGLMLTGYVIVKIINKFDNIEFTDKNGNTIKAHN